MFKKLEHLVRKYKQKLKKFLDNHIIIKNSLTLIMLLISGAIFYVVCYRVTLYILTPQVQSVKWFLTRMEIIHSYSSAVDEIIFNFEYTIIDSEKVSKIYTRFSREEYTKLIEGQSITFRTLKSKSLCISSKSNILNMIFKDVTTELNNYETTFIVRYN